MACTPPITRSPGSLFLTYLDNDSTELHSIGWHVLASVPITDLAHLGSEANRLAPYITACHTRQFTLVDWGVRTPTGHVYHQEPLTSVGPGTHAVNGNMQNYRSTTVAFVGRGNPGSPTGCSGRSISRLYVGGALDFAPGTSKYDAGLDATFQAFVVNGLNASAYLPADFYGQLARVSALMPVQFNASTQKRYGT